MKKFANLVKVTKETSNKIVDNGEKYAAISTAVVGCVAVLANAAQILPLDFVRPEYASGIVKASKFLIESFFDGSKVANQQLPVLESVQLGSRVLTVTIKEQHKKIKEFKQDKIANLNNSIEFGKLSKLNIIKNISNLRDKIRISEANNSSTLKL